MQSIHGVIVVTDAGNSGFGTVSNYFCVLVDDYFNWNQTEKTPFQNVTNFRETFIFFVPCNKNLKGTQR